MTYTCTSTHKPCTSTHKPGQPIEEMTFLYETNAQTTEAKRSGKKNKDNREERERRRREEIATTCQILHCDHH